MMLFWLPFGIKQVAAANLYGFEKNFPAIGWKTKLPTELFFLLKKPNRTLLTLMNSIYIHYEYFKILNEAKTLLFKYISVTRS